MPGSKCYKGRYCICLYDPDTMILITVFNNPREMSILWGVALTRAKRIFCERLRKPGNSKINGITYRVEPSRQYRITL